MSVTGKAEGVVGGRGGEHDRLRSVIRVLQQVVTSELDEQRLMELIAHEAMHLAGGEGASVERLDGDELVYVADAGFLAGSTGTRISRTGSLSGLAAAAGEVLVCVDTHRDPRANRAACERLGIGSMALVPLRRGDDVVAVLKVAWRGRGAVPVHAPEDLAVAADVIAARLAHTQALRLLADQQAQTELARAALEERNRQLRAHADATREIVLGADPRQALCSAALRATGGCWAVIVEPTDDELVPTGMAGLPVAAFRLSERAPSLSLAAYLDREPKVVTDLVRQPGGSAELLAELNRLSSGPMRSLVSYPILRGADCAGVLVVVSDRPLDDDHREMLATVGLLAQEAAIAFEREDLRRRLVEQADTDPLTHLANRRRWDRELAAAVLQARVGGGALSVGVIDLDHFKAYNDRHGHPRGDRLLTAAALAWQSLLRPGDLLARVGGEEFGLLLPGCSPSGAERIADRLRRALPERQSASVGLTQLRRGDTPASIVQRADAALYEAKAAGRNALVSR